MAFYCCHRGPAALSSALIGVSGSITPSSTLVSESKVYLFYPPSPFNQKPSPGYPGLSTKDMHSRSARPTTIPTLHHIQSLNWPSLSAYSILAIMGGHFLSSWLMVSVDGCSSCLILRRARLAELKELKGWFTLCCSSSVEFEQ
jgi:hypothetical protein